ncbi:MAG: HemK/PrmC family methyltransferase [Nitriliruptorales bacterium]|nr:HemK/PrmC family methyltransferase [Nitriliruptorales bacterium]
MTRRRLQPVLERHTERLRSAGVPSPEVDVRLLAAHVLGDDPGSPAAAAPTPERLEALDELVSRRAERIPLQHLVGSTWFRHVQLVCRPGVFIPRPETEVVAGIAIDLARELADPVAIEPCTGTGAIAAALVAEVPNVTVAATDQSTAAVSLATENLTRVAAGEAGVPKASGAAWSVHQGDLFAPLPSGLRGGADVVVANPPYMPAGDRDGWEPEVAVHDPVAATVGGQDGHEVVRRVLADARSWLRDGGWLVLEIDERRGAETAARARDLGYRDVRVARDLTGADRVVVGQWGHSLDTEPEKEHA